MIEPSDLLTIDELAVRLKVTKPWVYEQVRVSKWADNPLPHFKIGRFLRFSWAAVSSWIESKSNLKPAVKGKR